MDLKDLWKLLFSFLTTILLIPVLDFFKVENGIITKPIEKANDSTYKQIFYATKDFSKPVTIGIIIEDTLKPNILNNSSINVFAEDEIENKLQTMELVSKPLTKQEGIAGLPKGKYSLEIKFNNEISIKNAHDELLSIYFASNPNGGKEPELMRTVNAKWYHIYYFSPTISLIIFFCSLVVFFIINKKKTHEKIDIYG